MKTLTTTLAQPATILRIGGGICFIGHGLLALNAKAGFVGLLGTFGADPAQAVGLLKLIGIVDVLVGLALLFRPRKRVLQWAMLWTALTILAWGLHGDSLLDLARRVPYVTTPMALLFLLYGRGAAAKSTTENVASRAKNATSGTATSVAARDTDAGIAAINAMDLSMICMKLMDQGHGEGWTHRQCAEVAEEYRRYLTLRLLFPHENIVPNLAIDTMWHYHILDTEAYYRDCQAIFGELLHHYPYFGMKGEADEKQFVSAFDRTKILYAQTFGESMEGANYLPSFGMVRSA